MEPSTRFGFLSVLVLLVLGAFPNVSHGQVLGNFQLLSTGTAGGFQVETLQNSGAITVQSASTGSQTLDVVTGLFSNLLKKTAVPPPTGFDDAWAKEVAQANKDFLDAYTILIQQLALSAGVDNASINEVQQVTAENVRLFTNIFAQLAELMKIKSQTGEIDVVRANALIQTVGQNNRAFTHTFAQLADLMSKTAGTANAIAVIQAAHADIEAFTNVIKKLMYMPTTPDDASTNDIMQASNVLIGAFTNLTKRVMSSPPPPPPPPPQIDNGQGITNLELSSVTAGGLQVQTGVGGGVSLQIDEQSGSTQTLDVATRLLANLIKKTAVPPPTGFDDAWAKEVAQANGYFLDAYTLLIKQLANQCMQSPGVDNALVSEIMQTAAKNANLFMNIFVQLAELMKIKYQTGAIDGVRANALMQTVGQNNRVFTHTFARLADLMSKTGGTINVNAVIQAAHADIEAFTNVIKKLMYMPTTPDDASINEIVQAGNVLIGAFTSLTKQVMYTPPPPPSPPSPPPPSPKTDDAWAKAVLETNAVTTGAFTNVMKQIASSPEPCSGINNAWASAVRKSTGVTTESFSKLIQQLSFPPLNSEANYDKARENEIKQASGQSITLFTNLIKQLPTLVSGESQTDAIDKAWAGVVTLTADVVAGIFGNLEIQLANMPRQSSENYNAWASKVMRSSDILTQAFTILIDELVLAQSTGMIKASNPEQASVIVQSTSQSTGAFTKLIKLYVQPDRPQETVRILNTSSSAQITIG